MFAATRTTLRSRSRTLLVWLAVILAAVLIGCLLLTSSAAAQGPAQANAENARQASQLDTQQDVTRTNPAALLTTAPKPLDAKAIAKTLQAATVTIRTTSQIDRSALERLAADATALPGKTQDDNNNSAKDAKTAGDNQANRAGQNKQNAESSAEKEKAASESVVTISSGVSLGDGFIITFSDVPLTSEYHVTLPSGSQVSAVLRVADYYSGLRLLEIEKQDVPPLTLASAEPEAGEAILAASAAGIESPVLSLGMVAAAERSLSGVSLPPLLQCSLPTTDTSGGAAIVNAQGELIGIIAISSRQDGNAWTYAVPAAHALRLRASWLESSREDRDLGKVVVLRHKRPVVGMTLRVGDRPGQVVVEHVEKHGPAEKVGLRPGMEVLACEGVSVDSVYAVVGMVLKKQPGDTLRLMVRDAGRETAKIITLQGGEVVEPVKMAATDELHALNLQIGPANYQLVRNLTYGAQEPVPSDLQQVMELVDLLQRQKTLFAEYIDRLRKENDTLREENAALRKQVGDKLPD